MKESYSDKFKNVLQSIKNLLLSEQNIGQAKFIDDLLRCLEKKDYLEFKSDINSLNMWGGAGSVLDVYFEDGKLQKSFHSKLLRLTALMKEAEIMDSSLNLSQKIWF